MSSKCVRHKNFNAFRRLDNISLISTAVAGGAARPSAA